MKKVKVLRNYRHWIKPKSVFCDYNEGDVLYVLEEHAQAGIAAGAMNLCKSDVTVEGKPNGVQSQIEVGLEASTADTSSVVDTPVG